eukprot:TRINITY_DN21626_c0_g1_i1.p1 TRINITY_DN21626_c0_g1~~TRINITY_DN21626_c0_g1_i1.p1  ORF type:complete len:442 (+),score=77.11 TRINITY_DN21626_c0_g1_i1:40-1365(+)
MPVPRYTFDNLPDVHPAAPNSGMLVPVPCKVALEAVRRRKKANLEHSQREPPKKAPEIPYHGIRTPAEAHVMARMMLAKHRSMGYNCADPPTAEAAKAQAQMLLNSQQFDLHVHASGADKTLSVHTDLNVNSVEYWNSLNHELANNHSAVNAVNRQAMQSCVCPPEVDEREVKYFSCINCKKLCAIGSNFCQHCGCDYRIGAVRDAACSAIGFSSRGSNSSSSSFSMVSNRSKQLDTVPHPSSTKISKHSKPSSNLSSFIEPVQPISKSSVNTLKESVAPSTATSSTTTSSTSSYSSVSEKPEIVREEESLPPTPLAAVVDPHSVEASPGSPASKKNTACALDNDCISLSSAASSNRSKKVKQPPSTVTSHPSTSKSSSSSGAPKSHPSTSKSSSSGVPKNPNSQVIIADPHSFDASPGSPASKKNTACALDNDCIDLDNI